MASRELTVLLVDDDEVDRRRFVRTLRKSGVQVAVATAEDGLAALELMRGDAGKTLAWPYFVLLDINMPRMDGLQLLAELRGDPDLRHIVVIMLTSSDEERDLIAAYDHSVAGYVVKTVDDRDFADVAALIAVYDASIQFPRLPMTAGATQHDSDATREESPDGADIQP